MITEQEARRQLLAHGLRMSESGRIESIKLPTQLDESMELAPSALNDQILGQGDIKIYENGLVVGTGRLTREGVEICRPASVGVIAHKDMGKTSMAMAIAIATITANTEAYRGTLDEYLYGNSFREYDVDQPERSIYREPMTYTMKADIQLKPEEQQWLQEIQRFDQEYDKPLFHPIPFFMAPADNTNTASGGVFQSLFPRANPQAQWKTDRNRRKRKTERKNKAIHKRNNR